MTPAQIELARHALGLPNKRRTSYRNHYVVGSGEDHREWLAMVAAKEARRRDGNQLSGGDDIFWLTAAGAIAALKPREKLDPKDFPSPQDTP